MEGEPGEEEHLLLFPATPAAAEIRRKICSGGCDRPVKVCLCEKIPREPIPTTTQIVILQHPHEQRQKLATVPVLKKCLENCEIIVGRRLRRGHSPILDSLYQESKDSADSTPVCRAVFLFPGILHLLWLSFCLIQCNPIPFVFYCKIWVKLRYSYTTILTICCILLNPSI